MRLSKLVGLNSSFKAFYWWCIDSYVVRKKICLLLMIIQDKTKVVRRTNSCASVVTLLHQRYLVSDAWWAQLGHLCFPRHQNFNLDNKCSTSTLLMGVIIEFAKSQNIAVIATVGQLYLQPIFLDSAYFVHNLKSGLFKLLAQIWGQYVRLLLHSGWGS